jgi:hypothetical protein
MALQAENRFHKDGHAQVAALDRHPAPAFAPCAAQPAPGPPRAHVIAEDVLMAAFASRRRRG